MLLGQAEISALPPWLSLAIQGGSFALVATIVLYLYPKLSKESREAQDKREDSWRVLVRELQQNFDTRNDKVTAAFDRQTVLLTNSFGDAAHRIETAVVNVCRGKGFGTREGDHG